MTDKQKQDVLKLLPIITGIIVILLGIGEQFFITIWMTFTGLTMITYGIIKASLSKNDRQD